MGTDGLSSKHEGEGSLYHDCEGVAGRLGKLGGLYSRFRPENPDIEGTIPARRIAGATPVLAQPSDGTGSNPADGWSQTAPATTPVYRNAGDGGHKKIIYSLDLDDGEMFGQFCTYGSLVKLGPRRGLFLSLVPLVEPLAGTIRVWRSWLLDRCQESFKLEQDNAPIEPLRPSTTVSIPAFLSDQRILWTDYKKNVGVRFQVRHNDSQVNFIADVGDARLSCSLEIQGKKYLLTRSRPDLR